jgi:hypothetical protein
MVNLCLIQYLNGVLMSLKLIYQIKATQRITGLIKIRAQISSFQKSVLGLLVGVLIP